MNEQPVLFEDEAAAFLRQRLLDCKAKKSAVFVLTDTHTHAHCLAVLNDLAKNKLDETVILTVKAGEKYKSLASAQKIWQQLTDYQAKRDAVLINLGGGTLSDLGCFAASCYKRGISCINIPTTLLGMIDAAIGGKTGINFRHFKNHIGSFYPPEKVLIFTRFLNSLPHSEMLSASGEILKYGFIAQADFLEKTLPFRSESQAWLPFITGCANIKTHITQADPLEKNKRKILNFGHTVGHAFETLALSNGKHLAHGRAVACGMVVELFLSYRHYGLSKEHLDAYVLQWKKLFKPFRFTHSDIEKLIDFMAHDKKNAGQSLLFVLIEKPGQAGYNIEIEQKSVYESLEFYLDCINNGSDNS